MKKHEAFTTSRTVIVLLCLQIALTLMPGCDTALLDEGAENPLLLKFNPSLVSINGADDTTAVDVVVEKASKLMTARFSILFDPAVVEVTDIVTSGTGFMFSDGGAEVSILENYYDNENGKIIVGIGALKRGFAGASGDGKLATITFRSKIIQSADLVFIDSQPTDIYMSVYSADNERGWEEQQVLVYNGLVIVHEEIEVEGLQETAQNSQP